MNNNDWLEDFHHENGKYQNKCFTCNDLFIGYKRRITCKSCHIKHELWYNSLTSDEKIIHLEKLNAEVIEFFNT